MGALRKKEKVLWLPVVPRQPKHLAIAVLGPSMALVEITQRCKETHGVAIGLHPFSLDQDLPTGGIKKTNKQKHILIHLITVNYFNNSSDITEIPEVQKEFGQNPAKQLTYCSFSRGKPASSNCRHSSVDRE